MGLAAEIARMIEDALNDLKLPAGQVTGQLPGATLPPGGPSGSGYPPEAHTHPLEDLTQSGATTGQVVTWDGSAWVADDPTGGAPSGSAGGDLGGTYPNPDVVALQGRAVYDTAPTDGQVLTWDDANSRWAPADSGGGGFSNPMTTTGDMITGVASGAAQRLAIGTAAAVLTACGGVPTWQPGPIDPTSLIDRFRNGTHSAELFTLTNGVNEFDLWYEAGTYYFAYDNKTETKVRSASTIAGLSSASDTTPVANGRYPSIYYDGTTWHLWVWIAASNVTRHYTASSFTGTYTLSDSLAASLADVHVRRSPYDGKYYAGYKDISVSPAKIGVLVADSLSGSWTDLGYLFDDIGRASWHTSEEADPAPFFFGGRAYVSFGGWDGTRQRVALVEVHPTTMRAIAPATVIVDPLETWQQRNSNQKVFNPVFLSIPGEMGRERLYYSQNPNAAGVATGWGYVEVAPPPADGRKSTHGVFLDAQTGYDRAAGIFATSHGSATFGPNGVATTSSTGGVYGKPARASVGDFTLIVEFTAAGLPTGGNYAMLFRVSTTNSGVTPIIGMWIQGTGARIYAEVKPTSGTTFASAGSVATLATGTRYRATLRRANGAVTLWINGVSEASGSAANTIGGLTEWTISNQKGVSQAAAQQFNGAIHRVEFLAEALPLSRL